MNESPMNLALIIARMKVAFVITAMNEYKVYYYRGSYHTYRYKLQVPFQALTSICSSSS